MRNVKPKESDPYMIGGGPGKGLKKSKPEPVYPRINIDLDTLPEAKKWKVGTSYKVETELKMVGLRIGRYDNTAEFEIRKIGAEDMGEPAEEETAEGEE